MKRLGVFLTISISLLVGASDILAVPLDLSTFGYDSGVSVDSRVVTFSEDPNLAAVYLFNDTYLVGNEVTSLAFEYSFTLGSYDLGDHFVFELNYNVELFVYESTAGHFSIDLTPYQGQEISLAWGLIWGGDLDDLLGTGES